MTTPASGEYRDRIAGLIVFGILEILGGILCLLLLPLMLFGLAMAAQQGNAALSLHAMIPGMCIYALLGIVLIWLGIGSILARRWARALWVCLSGVWLGSGLVATPFVLFMASHLGGTMAANGQPVPQPAIQLITQVIMVAFMLLFYIVIPGALFLFYRSPHVRSTCEVRDPKGRWTDHCPLPVLALSLLTSFGAVGTLALLGFRCVFPFFGFLVDGAGGCVLILALSGTMLYLGRGLYRLQIDAWRLLLAVIVIMAISGTITFWRIDLVTMYTSMGVDSHVVTAAAKMGQMNFLRWMTPIWFLPWVGWLLFVRRYFPKSSTTAGVSV